MSPRFRSFIVILLPVVLLLGLALLFFEKPRPPHPASLTPSAVESWTAMDLSKAAGLDQIPGWDVRRGNYRLTELAGRRTLELLPEPIIEGKVLRTIPMRGRAGVRARMHGEKSRRAYPRFSIGLHQDRELHLRAFPGQRRLELVSCNANLLEESLLATAPLPDWDWQPEDWIWLELLITPQKNGASKVEGRLWSDAQTRPQLPQLQHHLPPNPGIFFAALQGAPYAMRSIYIDAAETSPAAVNEAPAE